MDIAGKSAFVTGAGSGIGRATASELARRGALVTACDIDAAALDETRRQTAGEIETCVLDVRDLSNLTSTIRDGAFDIVHNNAGIVAGLPGFPDTPLDRLVDIVRVNLLGVIAGTHAVIASLRERGVPGAIVNTASVAAFSPMPQDPVYASSKAAIVLFTRSCAPLADEFGIRVNAVCPGVVDTPIVAATGGGAPAPWLEAALATIKALEPKAVAAAVIELIEDESKAGEAIIVENEPA